MQIQITETTGIVTEITVSESALDAVRWSFNPSGNDAVAVLKALSAALISECEKLREAEGAAQVKRWAAIAITEVETAQMFAVKAATYGV